MKMFRTLTLLVATAFLFGCAQPAKYSSKPVVTVPTPTTIVPAAMMEQLPDPLPDLSEEETDFDVADAPNGGEYRVPRQVVPKPPSPVSNVITLEWVVIPSFPTRPEDNQINWVQGKRRDTGELVGEPELLVLPVRKGAKIPEQVEPKVITPKKKKRYIPLSGDARYITREAPTMRRGFSIHLIFMIFPLLSQKGR